MEFCCGSEMVEQDVRVIVLGSPGEIVTRGLVCTGCMDVRGPKVRFLASRSCSVDR